MKQNCKIIIYVANKCKNFITSDYYPSASVQRVWARVAHSAEHSKVSSAAGCIGNPVLSSLHS